MTQREFVISVVRLTGAFMAGWMVLALIGELLMPAGVLSMTPGVGVVIAIQIANLLVGLYLVASGRLVVNLVCRPE